MEPITLIAATITTLIFTKATEQAGRRLGDIAYDKISELINLVHTKFQKEGIEGKITKAEEEPSDQNKNRFKRELKEQMEDDEKFTNELKKILEEIKTNTNDEDIQSILTNLEADIIKAKNIKIEAINPNKGKQELIKDIKADDEIIAENIEIEAKNYGKTKQEVIKNIKGKKFKASNINIKTSSDKSEKKS